MRREYTKPEIEVTLFATESIMDSGNTSTDDSSTIEMEVNNTLPGEISSDTWDI